MGGRAGNTEEPRMRKFERGKEVREKREIPSMTNYLYHLSCKLAVVQSDPVLNCEVAEIYHHGP